jgi:diaminohydroxyphosphoribosylaminopyrimidine deaminase/5-amino-6-(5-phosphoribosylamino)uracil reductase
VQAIMVGTRTALLDNPQLTARKWFGANPTRIVIDRENKLPNDLAIFDHSAPTIVFTASLPENPQKSETVTYIPMDMEKNCAEQITQYLFDRNIYSLLVEGGTKTISSFIENGLWNEAFVEISNVSLSSGIKAPEIQGKTTKITPFFNATQIRLESEITRKFT